MESYENESSTELLKEIIHGIAELNQRLARIEEKIDSRKKKTQSNPKPNRILTQDNTVIYADIIELAQTEGWKDYVRFDGADGCAVKCGKNEARYVSISVSMFNKYFQKTHTSENEFLRWAEMGNLLLTGNDGRQSRVIRFPGKETTTRCITLKLY